MANYNTFAVFDCNKRRILLLTSSARKAKDKLKTGIKVEVWNENKLVDVVYSKEVNRFNKKYVSIEKQYIANKQTKAELRNKNRRRKRDGL